VKRDRNRVFGTKSVSKSHRGVYKLQYLGFLRYGAKSRVVLLVAVFILTTFIICLFFTQETGKRFLESFLATAIRDYLRTFFVAFILVFGIIRPFIIEPFKIPSSSMKDTLSEGDRILVCKFIYGFKIPFSKRRIFKFREIRRGDVFVFVPPHEKRQRFIKRVVAVAGDTVETRDKILYINGEPVDERAYVRYINARTPIDFPPFRNISEAQFTNGKNVDAENSLSILPNDGYPFVVPKGFVFAMGDNRDESSDSRFWGPVRTSDIKGKALFVYWSYNNEGKWWEFHKRIKLKFRRIK